MKTQEQIDEQIKLLKEARPKIVPISMFGTDNLELLDAQVRVLEQDMDSDDIWDRWDRDEEDMDTRSNAEEALNWRDETGDGLDLDNLVESFPMSKEGD
ncbi:hypothetical protein LCGC14_1762290 [marine sediment metagenome]|uniref:Uncharacterized protein n=1 Tax=marine sediment metagenome TaxID=412755 RepID=A0A0F9H0M5_9ZZZZ